VAVPVDDTVVALADQQDELSNLLAGLPDASWAAPTRCTGWDVADVVLHLAQTNEMAIGSVTGRYHEVLTELGRGIDPASSIDDGAARMVNHQRGAGPDALRERWSTGATRLVDELRVMNLSTRVPWVAGHLSARTLATTRLAETWIHTGDVADALGLTLEPGDRLRLIARLAWRTLPYAFTSAGLTLAGPVAFRLLSPDGAPWDFEPDQPAVTTISGPATELCAIAARRLDPSATSVSGDGPDVDAVLALVRTYA
jgi:uncharacterized protein (TIGR03084 family)